MEIDWKNYIKTNLKVLLGKPVLKGTRIPVDLILEKLSYGESLEQLLKAYPGITKEAILACLSFAAESVKNEVVIVSQ